MDHSSNTTTKRKLTQIDDPINEDVKKCCDSLQHKNVDTELHPSNEKSSNNTSKEDAVNSCGKEASPQKSDKRTTNTVCIPSLPAAKRPPTRIKPSHQRIRPPTLGETSIRNKLSINVENDRIVEPSMPIIKDDLFSNPEIRLATLPPPSNRVAKTILTKNSGLTSSIRASTPKSVRFSALPVGTRNVLGMPLPNNADLISTEVTSDNNCPTKRHDNTFSKVAKPLTNTIPREFSTSRDPRTPFNRMRVSRLSDTSLDKLLRGTYPTRTDDADFNHPDPSGRDNNMFSRVPELHPAPSQQPVTDIACSSKNDDTLFKEDPQGYLNKVKQKQADEALDRILRGIPQAPTNKLCSNNAGPSGRHDSILPKSPAEDSVFWKDLTTNDDSVTTWMKQNKVTSLQYSLETTPKIFRRQCYYYYTQTCTFASGSCERIHHLGKGFEKELKKMTYIEVLDAYRYAKERTKLFEETVEVFLTAFAGFQKIPILFTCIGDVINSMVYNKTPLVHKIILHLSELGLMFSTILSRTIQVCKGNICISDILLDIICFEYKNEICHNWDFIKILSNNRQNPVDYGVMEELLLTACATNNIRLAKLIVNDLMKSVPIDYNLIKRHVLVQFCEMLLAAHLEEAIVVRKIIDKDIPAYSSTYCDNKVIPTSTELELEEILSDDSFVDDEDSNLNKELPQTKNDSGKYNPNKPAITNEEVSSQTYSTDHLNNLHLVENELILDEEIINLRTFIEEDKCKMYFELLDSFSTKSKALQRQFAVNSLVCFKELNIHAAYKIISYVLIGIEMLHPTLMEDQGMRSILSMISINVIGLLENQKLYDEACKILMHFNTILECVHQTSWFETYHRHNYSEAGRYLYFCKIFVKGYKLNEAWAILVNPEFKLIYPVHVWQLKFKESFDNLLRNHVLNDLISFSINTDVPLAKIIILYMLEEKEMITEINIWNHFNTLILKMMVHPEKIYTQEIKELLPKILGGWFRNLTVNAMRSLLMTLVPHLPDLDLIELYNKCSKRKCYPYVKGNEKVLTLTTNMMDEEVNTTLHVYFFKKIKNNIPPGDLMLIIKLPAALDFHSEMLYGPQLAPRTMHTRVCGVLKSFLKNDAWDCDMTKHPNILLKAIDLQNCYKSYFQKYKYNSP